MQTWDLEGRREVAVGAAEGTVAAVDEGEEREVGSWVAVGLGVVEGGEEELDLLDRWGFADRREAGELGTQLQEWKLVR